MAPSISAPFLDLTNQGDNFLKPGRPAVKASDHATQQAQDVSNSTPAVGVNGASRLSRLAQGSSALPASKASHHPSTLRGSMLTPRRQLKGPGQALAFAARPVPHQAFASTNGQDASSHFEFADSFAMQQRRFSSGFEHMTAIGQRDMLQQQMDVMKNNRMNSFDGRTLQFVLPGGSDDGDSSLPGFDSTATTTLSSSLANSTTTNDSTAGQSATDLEDSPRDLSPSSQHARTDSGSFTTKPATKSAHELLAGPLKSDFLHPALPFSITDAQANRKHDSSPSSGDMHSDDQDTSSLISKHISQEFEDIIHKGLRSISDDFEAGVAIARPQSVPVASVNDGQISLDEADPKAIAAALHYHRTSPSHGAGTEKGKISCELCGALVLRWAILSPCNHRACSACCCSGVNQVSTTPPRKHTCAACQVPVSGLTLSFTAAEAARAAAWREQPDKDTDNHRYSRYGHDLAGRFPGVTEALLGLNRPVRGRSGSILAMAISLRPDKEPVSPSSSPRRGSGPFPEGHDMDESAMNPDSSMAFSEDASFYFGTAQKDAIRTRFASSRSSSPDPREFNAQPVLGRFSKKHSAQPKLSETPSVYTIPQPSIPLAYAPCAVVRVDNIPWTTSYQDIIKWCPEPYTLLPDASIVTQPVHIPVDLKSGKTANCAFIELKDAESGKKLIRKRNNTKLRGRPVSLQLSNYDEMRAELFPSLQQLGNGANAKEPTFLTPWQLSQMSQLVKKGGPQLKSPLKPIELMISWVQLSPPDMELQQRDALFGRAFEVVDRGKEWLNSSIDGLYFALHRLIQACVNCTTFTEVQKARVLDHVRCIPSLRIDSKLLNKDSSAKEDSVEERPSQISSQEPPVIDQNIPDSYAPPCGPRSYGALSHPWPLTAPVCEMVPLYTQPFPRLEEVNEDPFRPQHTKVQSSLPVLHAYPFLGSFATGSGHLNPWQPFGYEMPSAFKRQSYSNMPADDWPVQSSGQLARH
ncbi:unnamed protein product [Sympodiomycopsis kandeliae]